MSPTSGVEQRRGLSWCGVLGLVGTTCIVLGASRTDSPFTSKVPGSWFFGAPRLRPASGHDEWVGLLLTYAGVLMLITAWYCILTFCLPQERIGRLWAVLGAWITPLVVSPPLFSRDVYAYAAEGKLAAAGISPYAHTLASLGKSPFLEFVDPLWRNTHAPYGPFFLDLAGAVAGVMGHSVVGTVEGLRILAVVGVLLVAISIVPLARSFGRDPSTAFSLAVLNPLVLVYLIGGAHNDALMLGLLVSGVAVARARHPVIGIVLCSLAASIKIPALIGVVYIAWMWAGREAGAARRFGYLVLGGAIGGACMAVVSIWSGYGWGWLTNVSEPGKVVSWLDPATAAGLAAGHLLHLLGGGQHTHGCVLVARDVGLAAACAVALVMLLRSERLGVSAAIGWSLLAFALLGPIVWPWYETWGIVFLAVAANTFARWVILVLSCVGCFATMPFHVTLTALGGVVLGLGLGLLVAALVIFMVLMRRVYSEVTVGR